MSSLAEPRTDGLPARPLASQVLRFGAVGIAGFAVNAGLVALLAGTAGPVAAQLFAFPAAVTTTWSLNRRYTFHPRGERLLREWLRYVLANALGWAANNGALFRARSCRCLFAYRHAVVAVAAGSLAGMVFNFATSKWIVFR